MRFFRKEYVTIYIIIMYIICTYIWDGDNIVQSVQVVRRPGIVITAARDRDRPDGHGDRGVRRRRGLREHTALIGGTLRIVLVRGAKLAIKAALAEAALPGCSRRTGGPGGHNIGRGGRGGLFQDLALTNLFIQKLSIAH